MRLYLSEQVEVPNWESLFPSRFQFTSSPYFLCPTLLYFYFFYLIYYCTPSNPPLF